MSAINASNAFDRINHQLHIGELIKRNFLVCCIFVLY